MRGYVRAVRQFDTNPIKEIVKTNSMNGILFPDNIKADIKITKKIGIRYFKYLLENLFKNKGIKKNENIENL